MLRKVVSTFAKSFSFGIFPVLLIIFVPVARAQTYKSVVPEVPKITEKQLSELADTMGVPTKSKFRSRLTNPEKIEEHPLIIAGKGLDQSVIDHLKSTKGIPFAVVTGIPNVEEIASQVTELEPGMEEAFREAEEAFLKLNNTIPKLKRCESNITEKVANKFILDPKRANIMEYDVLYMREEDLPKEPGSAIGVQTFIFPFSSTQVSLAGLVLNANMIPCLPYRIRRTGGALYKDHGINALKNFDKNPDGSGELTEAMRTILNKGRGYED